MNYIEWVLACGKELLREREETLKKRLSLSPGTAAQQTAARAKTVETDTDEPEPDAPVPTTARDLDAASAEAPAEPAADPAESAALRLVRKLGLDATQQGGETGAQPLPSAAQTDTAIPLPVSLRASDAARAGGTLAWLQELLSGDGRDGAAAAAARETDEFSLSREQETRETESFSLSLERDARRYDGGFLYY